LKLSKLFPNNSVFSDFNKSGTSLPDKEIDVDAISGAFMLVKRKAIEDVGLLDEGYFLHCEDLDWCMRFKMAGYRILFVPNIVINHAKGGCSGNRPIFVEWHKHKGMLRFYRKFFLNSYPIFLYPMVVVATWTRFLLKVLYIGLRPNVR
jgi:GT2 family glycosyltransferase